MSNSHVEPSSLPNIGTLYKQLGLTTPSDQNKIRAKLKKTIKSYVSTRSLKCEDFTKWHLPEHQGEIRGVVEAFLDSHAAWLWPSDEYASQNHKLQYPKDKDIIGETIFRVVCRQSYWAVRYSSQQGKQKTRSMDYQDFEDEEDSDLSPGNLDRTLKGFSSRVGGGHLETIHVASVATAAILHPTRMEASLHESAKRHASSDDPPEKRIRRRLIAHLSRRPFQDNNTNTCHEQENTVVAECSARSTSNQSYDNDDLADDPPVSASEARSRTNSTCSVESSIADEAEPVPGLRASESTAEDQPPVGEDSARAVSTDQALAETGPTERTAATTQRESIAEAARSYDPVLPASHGLILGGEGSPIWSGLNNTVQSAPVVEFNYGITIQYPVHLRIPWTPRGHLASKTLSDMENELKTALAEGLTRTTGKQDFADLKDFRIESWRFDIRGHDAIFEFDVKGGIEEQFDHMKRKAKQEMRLAIQRSPESRPSFDIEIHIVTGRDSGIRQTGGRSFDW
ncbi:hypothetical protein CORC01_12965 [Colletotrichum orchidophilum]|uniref:Uncharacterized protein n=1 Tax=Colletotrichum orchidophilum TaxID=1209926 RepID=A0A1G4ARE6_9PEZI|nr:uncharacterized protein CORC01_12965 [Colletotrichum orchidophilum]OHE91738.1 hypothetical protein CORC01_12965 [Colletotrichum orchidophilum]